MSDFVVQALSWLPPFLAGLLLGHFLPSYVRKKAEHLATKQDIKRITEIVEAVKLDSSKQLEAIRTTLNAQLYIHKVRYEKEFEILSQLSSSLIVLRDASYQLRPGAYDVAPTNQSSEETKQERIASYIAASKAFYSIYETHQPFYSEELYLVLKELHHQTRKEAAQYAHRDPGRSVAD